MANDRPASPREEVLFLARAESRVRIMEALSASDGTTRRELRDRLDASRTTVSRALKSLAERGWVERSGDEYRLTRAGQILAAEFGGMLDTVELVDELAGFLRYFPADVDAPDLRDADDVAVTYSTDADPYAPARKQTEILHAADRLRLLLPAIERDSTETVVEQVTQRGLEVETVVSPDVASTMETEAFAPLIREKLQTGHAALLVAPSRPPFYLGLTDGGRVQVGLADDDGLPRSLLETSDTGVREWAEGVYDAYRADAERRAATDF